MKAELVETEKSVGRILCHDITRIDKNNFKGPAFKKGHLVREEDIPLLLDMGKKHIYSLELEPGELHEDEAGRRIAAALAGDFLCARGPSEGRVDLLAECAGLLKVNSEAVFKINSIPDVVVATLHNNSPVKAGEVVAGAKVVPLAVSESAVEQVEKICRQQGPPLYVMQYKKLKMGGVITGREVVEGRIKDAFAPVLKEKASSFGLDNPQIIFATDDAGVIADGIKKLADSGCSLIVVTGGMSVDPDDVTPQAIRMTGAQIVKYGAPVLPGAMFLLAYLKDVPVVGLPACGMFFRTTVLDVILPRLLAGEKVTSRDIAGLGYGGLCRRCEVCRYPNCSFGKGGSFNG